MKLLTATEHGASKAGRTLHNHHIFREGCHFLLTEPLQVVSTTGLRHGRDGHQWTRIPSQRLAETILAEVDLLGVHAFFQDVKVSLEQR